MLAVTAGSAGVLRGSIGGDCTCGVAVVFVGVVGSPVPSAERDGDDAESGVAVERETNWEGSRSDGANEIGFVVCAVGSNSARGLAKMITPAIAQAAAPTAITARENVGEGAREDSAATFSHADGLLKWDGNVVGTSPMVLSTATFSHADGLYK